MLTVEKSLHVTKLFLLLEEKNYVKGLFIYYLLGASTYLK